MREFLLELKKFQSTSLLIVGLSGLLSVVSPASSQVHAQDATIELRRERLATKRFVGNGAAKRVHNRRLKRVESRVIQLRDTKPHEFGPALRAELRRQFGNADRQPLSEQRASLPVDAAKTRQRLQRSLLDSDDAARRYAESFLRDVQSNLRVVGGEPVVSDDIFQDTVAIRPYSRGRGHGFCTGVLINRTAVLTAAHCVCNLGLSGTPKPDVRNLVLFGNTAPVNLAEALRIGVEIDTAKTRLFDKAFCRNYPNTRLWHGQDFAVLFLSTPAPEAIEPAYLVPPAIYLSPGTTALRVVGFGRTSNFDAALGDRGKLSALIPIGSKLCDGHDGSRLYINCVPGREMVLQDWYFRSRDTCGGDSGGPAYVAEGNTYYVAAITSRALDPRGTCGPGGVYSVITPGIQFWLNEIAPRTPVETAEVGR